MATNKVNIQDIVAEETLKARFTKLDADRSSVLDRARSSAKLTIPSIMPDSGHSETTSLETPYQAVGSRLVNNLASKLLLTLLPPNTSFFRLLPPAPAVGQQIEAKQKTDIEQALITIEQELMKQIEREALRVPTFDALKSLIVTGNALMYKTEDSLKTYKLNDFIVLRDFSGKVTEIITKETLKKDTLPEDVANQLETDDTISDTGDVTLYTRAVLRKGIWYEYQTVESVFVEGSDTTYKGEGKMPFIPLRWTAISGENYGRGLVEQYIGDFRSLEGLYQLLIEASAIMARVIFGKRPGSVLDVEDINNATNGLCILGDLENDITTLRVDKNSDLQVPLQLVQDLTKRLEQAFLVSSSATRQGERVTATEIRYLASDLEESLGGLYSILSLEYQRPLANLLLSQSKVDVKSIGVDIVIVTGIEALGRNLELDKLRQFNGLIQELGSPDIVLQRLNIDAYIAMIGNALSLDTASLIKSQEQIAGEQQQQQADALVQQGAMNMTNNATAPEQQGQPQA